MFRIMLLALIIGISCNTSETSGEGVGKDTTTNPANIATTPIEWGGCYGWAVKNDSASMELKVSDKIVSGKLKYDWFEKDGNSGTLKGIVQDSLLIANYTFQSEGMTSVREVVFKIKEDSLIEGYGDLITSGDTMKFKNKALLQFQTDRAFTKTDCP